MTITLSPDIEKLIAEQMAQGRFDTPDEAVAESVRFFKLHADFENYQREQLRAAIDQGRDEARRGETVPYDPDDMMRRVRERLASE